MDRAGGLPQCIFFSAIPSEPSYSQAPLPSFMVVEEGEGPRPPPPSPEHRPLPRRPHRGLHPLAIPRRQSPHRL